MLVRKNRLSYPGHSGTHPKPGRTLALNNVVSGHANSLIDSSANFCCDGAIGLRCKVCQRNISN